MNSISYDIAERSSQLILRLREQSNFLDLNNKNYFNFIKTKVYKDLFIKLKKYFDTEKIDFIENIKDFNTLDYKWLFSFNDEEKKFLIHKNPLFNFSFCLILKGKIKTGYIIFPFIQQIFSLDDNECLLIEYGRQKLLKKENKTVDEILIASSNKLAGFNNQVFSNSINFDICLLAQASIDLLVISKCNLTHSLVALSLIKSLGNKIINFEATDLNLKNLRNSDLLAGNIKTIKKYGKQILNSI